MDANLPSFDVVFCDWLDVTFSPEAFDYAEFYSGLTDIYPEVSEAHSDKAGVYILKVGYGTLHVSFKKAFIRVSVSGGVLSVLRSSGKYLPFLGMLTDWPHRVTRIDVSMDRSVSGPHVLSKLWKKYGSGISLGQRPVKTDRISSQNADGLDTGTFYAGFKKKLVRSVRVYDKAWEVLCKHECPIPKRTRYEFIMRGGKSATHAQPSLRDAALPEPLFWDMASVLLPVPKGVEPWVDTSLAPWKFERPAGLTVWEKFVGVLETSPDLDRLNSYALELGAPAQKMLISRIMKGITETDSLAS